MKLLIDTNIILDFILNRRSDSAALLRILNELQIGTLRGYISAMSIPNILYIGRQSVNRSKRESVVEIILTTFEAVDLKASDLQKPFKWHFTDYEDGLQAACAERIGAAYILTNNIKDFKNSPIPAITPEAFIKKIIP